MRKIIVLIVMLMSVDVYGEYLKDVLITPELKKAWMLIEAGQLEEARQTLIVCNKAITKKDKPLFSACNFEFAKILEKSNKPLRAAEHYRLAYYYSDSHSLKERAMLLRGDIYIKLGVYRQAKPVYEAFLAEFPQSNYIEEANFGIAQSLANMGMLQEALQYYEKSGGNLDVLYGKANVLQMLDRVEDAAAVYDEAVSLDVDNYYRTSDETLYYYGENVRKRGDLYKAAGYLSSVKGPVYRSRARISLGLIEMDKDNTKRAISYFESASKTNVKKDKLRALMLMARLYTKTGKLENARNSLKALLYLQSISNDTKMEVDFLLTEVNINDGKYAEAVDTMLKYVKDEKLAKSAIDFMTKAVDKAAISGVKGDMVSLWAKTSPYILSAANERVVVNVVKALEGSGKPYLELLFWLSKNGSNEAKVEAIDKLARIYEGLGDSKNALEYLSVVGQLRGESDELLRRQARILYENGELQGALAKTLELAKLEKDDIKLIRQTIGASNNVAMDVQVYENAVSEFGGTVEDYRIISGIYIKLGDKEKAIEYDKLILKENPADEWAIYSIYKLTADEKEAAEMLKKLGAAGSAIGNFSKSIVKGQEIEKMLKDYK